MPLATDEEVGIGAAPALLGDAEVGLPPTGDLPTPPSDSEEKIGPANYGRFAAARIAQARFKARAAGNDLTNPEQLAIMDAYRQAAGLPTLSNVDSFKEAQQHIARHQSDVLNLARSTAAAFERQAVDLVSEVVDKVHPNWGTETRRDIAAMNPFDPDRISGKAGGIVASLPLFGTSGGVLAGTKGFAAVMGLEAMTEALATSTDTGVNGLKKWGGSAAQGATTAVSLYLGGKIGEWVTKGLAGKIPELQRLLTTGATTEAADVVTRQAALAGIRLPFVVPSMVVGKIGDNLIAAQSTDPNRKWHDGLIETAITGALMEVGGAAAGIPGGVKAARTARQIEAGPRPEDIGRPLFESPRVDDVALRIRAAMDQLTVRTPSERQAAEDQIRERELQRISGPTPYRLTPSELQVHRAEAEQVYAAAEHLAKTQTDIRPTPYEPPSGRVDEAPSDSAVSPTPSDYPAGRAPTIIVGRSIQGTAGTAEHPEVVYIDAGVPRVLDIGTKPVDVHSFVAVHETTERKLLDGGMNYEEAHPQAQAAEHAALQRAGIDPIAYERALEPYEKIAQGRKLSESPGDLDTRPYRNLPKDRDRPKSIVTTEGNINNAPEGRELAIPHAYYVTADRMSPAGAKEFGSAFIENAGENLWVRPSADPSNAKRTLLIHISDALTRTEPPAAGESRVVDFQAPSEWIGRAAENLPDSDVYVVRNVEEARKFLDAAGYGKIAFSVEGANSSIVQKILEGYKGEAGVIGTSADTSPFQVRGFSPEERATALDRAKDAALEFQEASEDIKKNGESDERNARHENALRELIASENELGRVDPVARNRSVNAARRREFGGSLPPEFYEPRPATPVLYEHTTSHSDVLDWVKSQGITPKDGTDYRHFRDTAPPVEVAGAPDRGLLARLHSDETGAIPAERLLNTLGAEGVRAAGRAAVDSVASAAADLQRTFSPGSRGEQAGLTTAEMRRENSRAARKSDIRYRAYDSARQALDKYGRIHSQTALDDFMDRINAGKKQADPSLQALADAMDAERRAKVAEMDALGTGATEKFDENWFGRQWKQEDQARQFFRSRKPLTGSKTFLKGRTLESVAEGRSIGLELLTDNPVEMHIMKMGEMDKYIAGVNVIHGLEAQGAAMKIKSGGIVPSGWQRIHEQIGLYKAKNPVTGQIEPGSYYAPEPVATLVNNHLSPGLRNKQWFRTYLGAANWMNQLQLGMSGFHIAFTSADAIVSKVALGLRETVRGDLGHAITDLLGSPLAPVTNAMRGHKGLLEWFKPGSQSPEVQEIVGILEDAGARVQSDPFYRTHITDKMMGAFRKGNVLGGLGRALLLPVELPTRFIMDVIVPRQKLGVAMDIVGMEMRTNPGISREALVAKARSAWDSADNRMGQLVYDNLFWNRLTKDIAMASVRSVGWNLGTFREVLGGTVDLVRAPVNLLRGKPADLTNRAAYVLALPMIHAAIGSFLNYVFAGEGPRDLKDAFFPRTGEKDEKGNPQRISLPTYMKDIYHFGTEPLKTLSNKLHPMLTLIHEMIVNKDFYGEKVRNEDDPLVQQVKQLAVHAVTAQEPLSIRNLRRGLELGQSEVVAGRSFVGLTPAPSAINRTKAEQLAAEITQEKVPVGARTHEAVEKSRLKHDLARKFAAGDTDAIPAAIQADQISKDDAKAILKESRQKPLQVQVARLDAKQALQVWMVATPEERASIRVQLLKHLTGMKGHATIAERKEMIAQYRLAGVLQ